MSNSIDVFLSHNSKDRPAVRELAAVLRALSLEVWLDEDSLLPGEPWQEALEKVLETAGAGAVLVGQDGLGPWENLEMRTLLSQFIRRGFPVIPVLLPGAPQVPELPPFLREFTWSDLRGGMTPEAIGRLADGIRRRHPKVPRPDPLDRYSGWAAERYNGLSLIGLGGGDFGRLRFDEVYVPLRIVRRPQVLEADSIEGNPPEVALGSDELGIESLFTTPRTSNPHAPHALLLGGPGAGKTTGLLKLLHRCLAPRGPEFLGLDPETLPVFVRLRRFTTDDLFLPFKDFLQRELERELGDVMKGEAPGDLGTRLWEHGRLLLLLDGLDEIADEALRAEVCKILEDLPAAGAGRERLRAVISCRFAGYGDRVRLGDHFLPLEVRPLDAAQCRDLVRHWFRAAQQALPSRLSPEEALQATNGLLAALDGPSYGSQRWKVLVGSPLLLTLLCVIAYRGGQMPRHRAAFYDQCLRVLLGPWSHGKRDAAAVAASEPPLDVETALAVLRSIAWELHRRQAWDDLSVAELSILLGDCLAPRGRQVLTRHVLEWLHRESGVLADYGEHRYGFLHLGLQEYLTASHIASQGLALLDELCAHAGEEWWQEVFLLLSELPGHAVFAPLMDRLLRSPILLDQADLIRACLEEAAEPDLGPFIAVLAPGESPERQATVLRLLRGRNDPRIETAVRDLLGSLHLDVKALARQIVDDFSTEPAGITGEAGAIFVLHHPADREVSTTLAQALRGRGWHATAAAEGSAWRTDPERLVRETRGVVVPVADGAAPWEERELQSFLRLFARSRCTMVLLKLPGCNDRPALPEFLPTTSWVDVRGGFTSAVFEELDHALAGAMTPAERPVIPGELIVEPLSSGRLLWIPGGQFQMGDTESPYAQPVHLVRVSPFWLGETPVTNAQYAVFLEKTDSAEPQYWRDRRFSSPDQPVVGVSWGEARAFCRWLGEMWGRPVMLPSEAQWEFAARGPETTEYPWGSERPDATRACFDLDWEKGQPASVGSYPAGRGAFGTLDQAGNVWEWCCDAWDQSVYRERATLGEALLDPTVEGDEGSERVVRGGGWSDPAENLRAAVRNRVTARKRLYSVGFRVGAGPLSPRAPSAGGG